MAPLTYKVNPSLIRVTSQFYYIYLINHNIQPL